MAKQKYIYVKWLDAMSCNDKDGHTRDEVADHVGVMQYTAGWLIDRDARRIVVGQNYTTDESGEQEFTEIMTIPAAYVKKTKVLGSFDIE